MASRKQCQLVASRPVWVQDMGLSVGPVPVWVEQHLIEKSECLRALIRMGSVRVSSGQRCRVSKDPPKVKPQAVYQSRKGAIRRAPTPPPAKVRDLTPEEAAIMINKAATEAAQAAVAAMLSQMQSAAPAMEGLEDRIEQAVSRAVGSVAIQGGASPSVVPITAPEDPLYIPTGIVKADAADLKIQSSSEEGEGLDDAASALKAIRRKAKKE